MRIWSFFRHGLGKKNKKLNKKNVIIGGHFINKNAIRNIPVRIDVIEIYVTRSKRKLNHIKNAVEN